MTSAATLENIRLGTATPKEARTALGAALREISPSIAQQVYTTLRAWVWKALDQRRRDDELREWFDIMKRAEAYLSKDHSEWALRTRVLHELLYESISVAELKPASEVLKRRHVKEVLMLLHTAPEGRVERARIGERLRIKQANLTRVINMMMAARLVERSTHGKQAVLQLTRDGLEAAVNEVQPDSPSSLSNMLAEALYHHHLAGVVPTSLLVDLGSGTQVVFEPRHRDGWIGECSARFLGLDSDGWETRNPRDHAPGMVFRGAYVATEPPPPTAWGHVAGLVKSYERVAVIGTGTSKRTGRPRRRAEVENGG